LTLPARRGEKKKGRLSETVSYKNGKMHQGRRLEKLRGVLPYGWAKEGRRTLDDCGGSGHWREKGIVDLKSSGARQNSSSSDQGRLGENEPPKNFFA